MAPSEFQVLHLLALQKSKLFDENTIRSLAFTAGYSNVSDFAQLKDYLASVGRIDMYPDEKDWNKALKIVHESEQYQIAILPISSHFYPKYLRAIDDSPNLIHLRGDLSCLQNLPGVSVVGTRQITENGKKIAYRIANVLAKNGFVVVSGLALGVDAIAHEGALDSGKSHSTIAVLAHGLEHAKPVANKVLAQRILENGGLWISEHHVGVPPQPSQFVARNRIQLGLSVGSVIIEADLKSGSVTQARFCVKQKRPLFAVIPQDNSNPLGLLSAGTEMMVSDMGAYPLKTKDDYPLMLDRFKKQYSLLAGL